MFVCIPDPLQFIVMYIHNLQYRLAMFDYENVLGLVYVRVGKLYNFSVLLVKVLQIGIVYVSFSITTLFSLAKIKSLWMHEQSF